MNSNLPKFSMVMTSDDKDVKRSTEELRSDLADLKHEAAQSAPAFDRHAEALNKEAAAADRAAKANRELAAAEKAAREEAARASGIRQPPATPSSSYVPQRPTPQSPAVPPRQPPSPPANENDREGRFRRQGLMYQGFDIGQGLLGGMPLGMIAAQQGPQIAQNYIGQGGGLNGFLKDVGSLASGAAKAITPLTVGVTGLTAAIAIGAGAWSSYLDSQKELETSAGGLGRAMAGTAAAMEASARAGAAAAGISVSSARAMEAQFLRTGRIGSENFEQLIGISKDFGATIGMDAEAAGAALAEMFADPAKAAQVLYQQYGLIDAATARQVTNLAQQNRETEAQAVLLKALPSQLADAEQATTALGRAWDAVAAGASNAYDWIGRSIDRIASGPSPEERIAELQASIAARGGAAAGRRDGDVEQRELDRLLEEKRKRDDEEARKKQEAEAIAASRRVRSVADASGANSKGLRIESLQNDIKTLETAPKNSDDVLAARDSAALEAKKRVLDALLHSEQRNAELDRLDIQIQNERNPLLRAELEARRTRLQLADQEISSNEIARRSAEARNHVIEETIAGAASQAQDMQAEFDVRSRLNGLVATGAITSADANRMLQEELTLRPLIAAAAIAEGDAKTKLLDQIAALRDGYNGLAAQEKQAAGQEYLRGQNEKIEQLRVEQALIGANDTIRARSMARLQAEQEIRRRGIDGNSSLAAQIRDQADATAQLNRQIDKQAEAWSNVQRAGEDAIDGMIDKLADGDLGGALDSVKDALTGFVKDDIKANLQNALLGTDKGTSSDIGGIGGIFSRLLSGGKGDPSAIVSKAMGQSVGAMTVTAASVTVNGGITGGLNSLLPGQAANSNDPFGALLKNDPATYGAGDKLAWNFWKSKGLADHQVAGILGNIKGESGFNPGAIGDGGAAKGLYQWNDRAPSMLAGVGADWKSNPLAQHEFAYRELMGPESRAWNALLASKDTKGATAAFAGFERPSGFSWDNPEAAHNFVGRLNGANEALSKFGGTTNVASEGLGSLGTGLDQVGKSLTSFFPAAPSAPAGGGLGGLFSNLFGGLSAAQISKYTPMVGLFDGGGYTGPGGVHEPRGVVHAGEIVWSQRDIAKAGGVQTVEAMRLGRRGYAEGGFASSSGAVYSSVSHRGTWDFGAIGTARNAPIIHNYGREDVEYEETTDQHGNQQPIITFGKAAASAVKQRGNPLRSSMQSEFGLKPARIPR